MTIYEILKDMGGSDERIQRKGWKCRWGSVWVGVDHDSGRMFLRVAGREDVSPWMPRIEDLEADDWEYWAMPEPAEIED